MNRLRVAGVLASGFALVLLFAPAPTGSADDLDNITFEGTVRDNTGAVIAGANLVVRNSATRVTRSAATNSEGRYRIAVSEPGNYTISVSAPGFGERESGPIAALSGKKIANDFSLTPQGVSEQITVSESGKQLIDTTRTVIGETFDREQVDALPLVNHDPLQLVFLLGGVTEAPLTTTNLADEGRDRFFRRTPEEAGVLSMTGAPAASNNITIDGLDNNDDRAARERISINPESIAEVQVITNQYAAEYGRASGGRINIRTRSGSSQHRGEAYFAFGDEALNANTFFRNARGIGRIPEQRRREGVLFSGPLRKQKEFFFAGYERFDITDSAEVRAFLPTRTNPAFPLPLPNQPTTPDSPIGLLIEDVATPETRNLMNARVDLDFGNSHSAAVRADLLRGSNKRGFPGGPRLADSLLIEGRDSDSISAADNLVISPRVINQARVQFSRLFPRSKAGLDSPEIVVKEPVRITAGPFTGSKSAPAFAREEMRIQLQDGLSLIQGNHLIKVGGDVQLIRSSFADLFAGQGQFTFETVEDFLAGRPSRFVQRFETESRLSNDIAGVFVQDEWRIIPNLTLSFGGRWDNESILRDRDNFSPRVAVAWDPFGGRLGRGKGPRQPGRTVVRAGFGLFYNRALLRTIDDFSLGKSTLLVDSEISPGVLPSIRFPQPLSDQALIARFGVREAGFLRRVNRDLKIPYTLQTGLGIERQIGRSMVATADYIFTRGAHLWRESNINAPVPPPGFRSLTEYLMSRDFDNRPGPDGRRPIAGVNAEVVRFSAGMTSSSTPGAIHIENGLRVLTLGLNAPRSTNITAALNAIRFLRPDPALSQVELLESTGNSFYHGGIFSVRYSPGSRVHARAVYTLSRFIDEGTTNTASPQDLGDRRAERALSLQDQRHRISFSGLFQIPLVRIDLAPVIQLGSSRPFNIGAGFDRNLNDIETDRPNFVGSLGRPRWRRPGSSVADSTRSLLALAPIGSSGNLPRNYGRGPGTSLINLRASRTFSIGEHRRLRPAVEVYNLLNQAVFSFGSEFIDRDDADFLVPRRTLRPRTIEISLKVTF